MSKKLDIAYLKHYFGQYLVKVDNETLQEYNKKFSKNFVFYLKGSRKNLLEAGFCFLAFNQNYKECMKIKGYDLIEFFLNHNEMQGLETFYNIEEKNLIIYHLAGTTPNTRLVSLIEHVATFRALEKKYTLILSEEDIFNELQDGQTEIVNLNDTKEEILSDI